MYHYVVSVLAIVLFLVASSEPWKMLAVGVLMVSGTLFMLEFLNQKPEKSDRGL